MQWRNQSTHWGLIAVVLHWLVAVTVLGQFFFGWWMTGLSYYDYWYKEGPYIHKSVGLLLFAVWGLRLLWRRFDTVPAEHGQHAQWERSLAKLTHRLLYLLLLLIMVSGYLISTADGRGISLFGWFEVPAIVLNIENQEDVAGAVHWYTACLMMALVALHAGGAIKHQFIDRDGTLTRMLGRAPKK